MKQKLFSLPVARYLIAGGLSYVIELTCLLTLHELTGMSVVAAAALAFWVGLVTSFLFQKLFAFKNYQREIRAISRQIVIFVALVLVNYLFTLIVVALFPSKLILVSRTIALIIVTCWNYAIYKIIFKKGEQAGSKKGKGAPATPPLEQVRAILTNRRLVLFVLLCLPVVAFFYQYLTTGNNKTLGGDFDYYSQAYQAFRITVLHFHQLPLWNPWLSGGIPLDANPQFGLFSIQSLLVLPFGAIYGLKLAYVIYALAGFWGMFFLGRRVFHTSKTRSALIGYIWAFSGFFAGHTIAHFTFTSFFLLPWLVYFIARRQQKYSWLGLGIVEAIVILSSVHYAFLMMTLMLVLLFIFLLLKIRVEKDGFTFAFHLSRADFMFGVKAIATTLILAGYQLFVTYHFVSHNQRSMADLAEAYPTVGLILKSIFLPIGTLIHTYPKTTWGWGEYSMYIGLGTGAALLVCLATFLYRLFKRYIKKERLLTNKSLLISVSCLGLLAALFALGNFGSYSPFHLLRMLPGFTETRVPSRWEIFTIFSLLLLLLSWRKSPRAINVLLFLSVVELFIAYGPLYLRSDWYTLPAARFSNTFQQEDNGHKHMGVQGNSNIEDAYFYSTSQNRGEIYADDSLINTLSGFTPLPTSRCASNDNPNCTFVITHNATITYWSPNKITLKRTAPGPIELNMNVDAGWQVNEAYPYAAYTTLEPARRFILPSNANLYKLVYAPKFSLPWLEWHLSKR